MRRLSHHTMISRRVLRSKFPASHSDCRSMAQVYSPWHAFIRPVNRLKRRSRRTVGATRPGAANNPSAGTLHRYFGQPGIQKFHLLGSGIDERYAHAHAVLHVHDLALRFEHALVARDAHVEASTLRQRDQHIHVTSLAADLRNAARNARVGLGLAQFDAGDQCEARYFAVLAIRSTAINGCTRECAHELFSQPRQRLGQRRFQSGTAPHRPPPFSPPLTPKMNRRFLFASLRACRISLGAPSGIAQLARCGAFAAVSLNETCLACYYYQHVTS